MKKLTVALMIVLATTAFAAQTPVMNSGVDYTGSYKGPDASYGLVLETRNGRLHGNYVESGRLAVLSPIEMNGAEFTATASFGDGTYRTISGTFTTRGAVIEGTQYERL
jgi:hypothetical protein